MNRIPLLALSAVFLTTGFTFHDPVSIKRTPKVGDTASFTMEATMNINGQDGHITGKGNEKVTAVDQTAGTFTTIETQSDVTFNDSPVGQDQQVTQVQKLTGEVVSITGGSQDANPYRFQDLIQPYLPSAPLNVGDAFTMDIKSTNDGIVPIHVDGKLVAMEKVGSFDTAKLEETVKETGGTDPGSAHSFLWVNVVDGSLIKQTADLTNIQLGPISVSAGKMSLTRVQS
jgi:hypothetical protein